MNGGGRSELHDARLDVEDCDAVVKVQEANKLGIVRGMPAITHFLTYVIDSQFFKTTRSSLIGVK